MTPNITTIKRFIHKHGSTILTGLGCVGVVGTGVLAYKAGKSKNKKLVIPPIIVGGATIVAIILSHAMDAAVITGLTASGAYVVLNRKRIEDEIKKQYGEDSLKNIKKKVSKLIAETYTDQNTTQITIEQSKFGGDLLCFEGFGGRVFRASEEIVENAINTLNERFDNRESLCYNDLYDLLGIRETRFGYTWGWVSDPDYYEWPITIEYKKYDNPEEYTNLDEFKEPVLVIDVYSTPMLGWEEI